MRLRLLAKPKFLVPLVLLLWLMVALPLSISRAEVVSPPDAACGDNDLKGSNYWARGVWGQVDNDPSGSHLALQGQDMCYKVVGTLVWGEWWRDKPQDCDRTNAGTAYGCSDSDMNWYLRLDDPTSVGVTPTEINQL